MRNEKDMLNAFMPPSEKNFEARLFIDEAIKNKAEYTLEAVARALSGPCAISVSNAKEGSPYKNTEHIKGDDGEWVSVTNQYSMVAKMNEFVFYGNKKTELWLRIIDFWAGREAQWPCGGASFPNEDLSNMAEF